MQESTNAPQIPWSNDAERAVLGAMIISPKAQMVAIEELLPSYFYRQAHRLIFETMAEMFNVGKAIDSTTLFVELNNTGKIDLAGGTQMLTSLTSTVPTSGYINHYAEIVKNMAIKRRIMEVGSEIEQIGLDSKIPVVESIDKAESLVYSIDSNHTSGDFVDFPKAIDEVRQLIEMLGQRDNSLVGLPTGFTDLDKVTSGFQGGQLIVIAARPGKGKSAFVTNIAKHIALNEDKLVAFFSLEMSYQEISMRLISQLSGVGYGKVQTGKLDPHKDWPLVFQAIAKLHSAPFFIDDSAGNTVMQIRQKCRRLKQTGKDLGIIIVDYLQLLTSHRPTDNRVQEVAEFSRGLKMLAKELDVPVIALSQLSRKSEGRNDKRPQLSDLRDSGAIEQDADIVMFIHREDDEKVDPKNRGKSEIIIGKHRAGERKTINLFFEGGTTQFKNYPEKDMAPPLEDPHDHGDSNNAPLTYYQPNSMDDYQTLPPPQAPF